jgi:hypothetical protein
MSIFALLMFAGGVAVTALLWAYDRARRQDRFAAIVARHQTTAKISSHAQLVDGRNHIPVALTLEASEIFYENDSVAARMDIVGIDEIEYDTELGTGKNLLRIRSHGQRVEFLLDAGQAQKWSALLPAHRLDEPGAVHAV